MAEGRRRRRGPQGKVANQDNVLRVNLDLRAGLPRATLNPNPVVANGAYTVGLGGPPQPYSAYCHPLPAQHNYQFPAPRTQHQTPTTQYRVVLDEPPKYDDIFRNNLNVQPSQLHQGQNERYEKSPLKSYFLRHFPKAKTVNNSERGAPVVNDTVSSSGSVGVTGGRSRCYSEINIPPTTPLQNQRSSPVGGPPSPRPHLQQPTYEQHNQCAQQQFLRQPQQQPQQQQFRQQQQHSGQQQFDQFGYQQNQQQPQTKKFTITLKPGHYQVNVQWRSKTRPFSITLAPKKKASFKAPSEQQPLYYATCPAPEDHHFWPRRMVHRLLFGPHPPTPLECDQSSDDDDSCDENMSPAQLPQQAMQQTSLQQQVAQERRVLQQQVGINHGAYDDRKGQKRCWNGVSPRHRQRKSRYRWASLSCMHLGTLDDSVGETSGGDSYGGYEGVEHLKRHSLSHARAASCESLACRCRAVASTAGSGFMPSLGNYGLRNMRRRGVAALGVSARLNSLHSAFYGGGPGIGGGVGGPVNSGRGPDVGSGMDTCEGVTEESFIFVEKSQLKCEAVSCEVLRNDNEGQLGAGELLSKIRGIVSPPAAERKTWHEDEAFVKQVVEEYFKDPAPHTDSELKDSEVTLPPAELRVSEAEDKSFLGGKPVDLKSSSSSSSSSSSTGSASCSSSCDEAEGNPEKELDCGRRSIDTTYCDTDESSSWFTDDSEGYEADVEPSDKDTLGQMWRRWRSAPDVRLPSYVRARLRGQQLGQATAAAAPLGGDAAYSSGVSATKNGSGWLWRRGEGCGGAAWGGVAATHATPYKHLPVCGYQTRKSCSVDETKLSRLRLGLRKVKEHKLLQFPQHDLERRRRPSKVNGQSNTLESVRVGVGEESLIPADTTPNKEDVDDHVFTADVQNLEFVNGKFKAVAGKIQCKEAVWECARKSVGNVGVQPEGGGCGGCRDSSVDGGASVDDSTTERTHRVLSQGLVVHHSTVVHDPHSILNASVIKNALSILREGIAAQELETTKSSEPENRGTHTRDTQVKDVAQLGCRLTEGERIIVASVNLAHPAEDNAHHDPRQLEHQDEVLGAVVEQEGRAGTGSGEQGHTEVASVDLVQDKEMNRSNITIHLTPPLNRRTNKDEVVKPTPPQSLAAKEQPFVGWGKSASKVNDCRTYQNVEPCDKTNAKNGSKQVDEVSGGGSQRMRSLLEADPSPRSSSVDTTRRSVRTSSEWRASTDTLSSSSGTSSCCHARPKPKSKTARKLVPQSPGHSRRRQTAPDGSSGTTSSASVKVFGNEFHLHRVQVGTGTDRKYAQATQRTVFEVPVSGGEQSDSQTLRVPPGENKQCSGGGATVQKSELVLGPPQFRGSQGERRKHPPTFLSSSFPNSKICVSEYNIGDAQPAPEAPRLLAHEFKLSNIDDQSDKVKRKSNQSSGKNKAKSKPRKYFSGILNAIGSAAPRLRGAGTGDKEDSGGKDDGGRVTSEGECGVGLPRERVIVYGHPAPCSGVVPAGCKSSTSQGPRPPTATTSPGGEGRGEPHAAISSKPEVIQVRAHAKDSASGLEYDISNDVVPVPSPRPRRALKNSHDSPDNVAAPTPPTRRRNTEESASKTIINGASKESGHRCESPRASPRARRGREPNSESVERNFRCNLPNAAQHLVQTNTNTDASYENLTFHEKHSFGNSGNSPASEINCDVKKLNRISSETEPQASTKYSSLSQGLDSYRSRQSRSRSAETHVIPSGGDIDSAQQHSCRSGRSCGGSNEESSNKHGNNSESGRASEEAGGRAVTGGHGSGSGRNNSGSTQDIENAQTHTTDSRENGDMNGSRAGLFCDEWSRVSGRVEGGSINKIIPSGWPGADSSSSTPVRRRRSRPPSLPTTPPQLSRARRTSQSSTTSGGSLPSSPTRWRRPQAEDTWEDSSVDGSHEGRLSNSPSAESVASESTSFYYSAAGSVYDRPKSLNGDATARYSFVTCPQYEGLTPLQETTDGEGTAAPVKLLGRPSATTISRTISGDLNCDVDVNLSEGEIKIRVRTDDEDVISSTSIHDDDSDDTDSDCDEYELCSDIKNLEESTKCDSPEICNSTCDSEKLSLRVCESEDDPLTSDGGVVHAVPYVAGTDSSNRSSVSSPSMTKFRGRYLDSLSSHDDSRKRESTLVHATPCWATTDSDMRSSVSSADYYGKVYLSATPEEKVYEPEYENVEEQISTRSGEEDTHEASDEGCSSEPKTQKRRLSGVWTTEGETGDVSSEWEEETLSTDLHKCFNNVSISDSANDEAPQHVSQLIGERHPEYHEPAECSTLDEEFIPEEVQPLSPTPQYHDKSPSVDERVTNNETAPSDSTTDTQNGMPGWEQHTPAWEWHKTMWEHHQHIHQQHLYHLHQHHQQHQSLLADVMSCLGGRWGMGGGSWSHHPYPDSDASCAHLQDTPTPDSRWLGQFQDDPPYRPASAASDLGKPPPSPLPPSGSHRSRDTSSVPREGSRPLSRQKSRSRRRAHSANSKYRVELEIPPHLFSRPRPSSFSSLATRRQSSQSPEPLEDDLTQEALLYLSEAAYDRSVDASRRRLAERKKNEGNELYKNKDYREALKLYTQAIDLCPDCAAYFSNRSACYMMLGKYYEALNDAREAVRLDTSFVKGYLRVAKCNIALGDATAALSVLRQASELEPNNRALREETTKAQSLVRCQEEVVKATAKADYRTAIFHLDRALDLAVGCRNLKITKAEYLVFLQRYADAQEMVNEILQYESGNADAIYVRGMCLYYQDNPEAAFNHFQHVLRLAPDHQKARDVYKKAKLLKQKKEEGNDAFKKCNFQEAFNLYTEALAIDPLNKHTNAKLYFNRATVGSKLNKLEQATEDCTAAINLDEVYVKAYLRRAKCYQLLEKHEEAVRDYEKVTRLDRNQEHKRLLHEAKIQLKRSKRKDYYKILGVGKTASDDEIKKSYRKMALVHHPDRHANASDKDKHEHEIKFKEIGEAYSVLTDAKKRAMYDRGQDINDPEGGFGHDDIDPNQIFQAFFGGGHGGYSFGGHNAGFQQAGFPGNGFGGGGFPGGFHFQFG